MTAKCITEFYISLSVCDRFLFWMYMYVYVNVTSYMYMYVYRHNDYFSNNCMNVYLYLI